jgi:AcrR family transcriptional regulator
VTSLKKKRQLFRQEEIRKLILDAAREIIAKEGFQGLSIRKITNRIEYSPAIIYHYFKDKNEIVESLVSEAYGQILATISSVKRNEAEPEKEMKEVFINYIEAALASPEVYKEFMLNNDPSVLKRTGLLRKGISKTSRSLKILCENIQRGAVLGRYAPCDPELTAQIIWTSTFGLIIKIIIEKDIPKEQINRLIDQHFTIIFNGIMLKREA